MVNSINIGKLIYGVLIDNEYINNVVGDRIFPIIAENDTDFPFITYSRTNIYVSSRSKDGVYSDNVNFNIVVCSDSYQEACEIANKVRECFEGKMISNNELNIKRIELSSINENWNENTYVENMIFSCIAE